MAGTAPPAADAPADEHKSSPLAMISGFVPWIVYWILVGNVSFRTAVGVAFALSAASSVLSYVRRQPPKVLEIGGNVAFLALLVVTFATNDQFLERWIQPLTNGALLVVILGGLAVGQPFTLQYARESVPAEVAAMPGFLYLNKLITWVWAAAFAVMTASAAVPPITQGEATIKDGGSTLSIVFYWVVPFTTLGLAALFSGWFPDWFTKSVDTVGAPAATPTSPRPPAPAPAPADHPRSGAAELSVEPADGLLDGAFDVSLHGLPAGSSVTVSASTVDFAGQQWRSEASLVAQPDGSVNLRSQAPASGTWSGVDGGGLIWSMRVPEGQLPDLYIPRLDAAEVTVTADVDVVGSLASTVTRRAMAPGCTRTDVRDGSLVATLYLPPDPGPHPGVVVFPGSEGGLDSQASTAGLLASHGYASLVVAYFGTDGLEDTLVELPLERFAAGLAWLRAHPGVDGHRVAAMSISKGAEGLLAAAAHHPDLGARALVLTSPSNLVWQASGGDGPVSGKSSWTLNGEPLPYQEVDADALMGELVRNAFLAKHRLRHHRPTLLHLAASYRLPADAGASPAAIPCEAVPVPVLCLAGAADELWPSPAMAAALLRRRADAGVGDVDEGHEYAEAGHLIRAGLMPTQAQWTEGIAFGGTPAGLAAAQADYGPRVLAFLARHLG